jgi:hypothetical protein
MTPSLKAIYKSLATLQSRFSTPIAKKAIGFKNQKAFCIKTESLFTRQKIDLEIEIKPCRNNTYRISLL